MVPWVFVFRDRAMPDDTELGQVLALLRSLDRKLDTSHATLDRKIEGVQGMVKTLIDTLAEEEEEEPGQTLDGEPAGLERDQSQSLG